MSNLKENTIRSVLFSSPLNFNHTLNRMSFLGASFLIGFTLAFLVALVGLTEDFVAIIMLLLAMLGLLIVQCKVMYARFSEFIAKKATIVQAIVGIQGLSFAGGFFDSPEIAVLAKTVSFIVFLFLLFTPATTLEQEQVQAS